MEKHNTDDIFKKMLENAPPMRPDMEALADMNRRLDAQQPKSRIWWLIPLLLLPFLFCSFFFYNKYQLAQNTINELNIQLTNTNSQQDTQTKTVTERVTVYQYDTIFNTVYQDVIVKRNREEIPASIAGSGGVFTNSSPFQFAIKKLNSAFAEKGNTFDNSSIQPSQLELLRDGKVLSLGQMGMILNNDTDNSYKEDSKADRSTTNHLVASYLENLSFLNNRFAYEHPLPNSDHFLNLTRKSDIDRINPLWALVPTGLQLGINWSPIGIANLPGSNNRVKSIGILGEVEFTKNTRLQFGLDYLNMPLKGESLDEISQFPVPMPNDPADLFAEVYGDFTYLQVPLTFKYLFQPNKRWKPSIGIGMIARLPLKEQFRYEFISSQGGEYKQVQALNSEGFSVNNVRGTIGIEYNIYKRYSIQAEGYYNHQFGESSNPYFKFQYGGLNLGLKYKF